MKNTVKIICFGLLISYYGCLPEMGDWEVTLYEQKIEGTSKVLYKYDAWGGLDSHAFGFRIMDSTETFYVNIKDDLPFYFIQNIPNKNIISGVSHKCGINCGENYSKFKPIYHPIEVKDNIENDITIKHKIYQYRGFSERGGGLERFQFEHFRETRDSLFFYDLDDVESKNGKHLDSLKLKKKMVVIRENNDSEVIKLTLEDLRINSKNDEIISNKTYFLTPKNKTKVNEFSDYGIFKKVKK